MKPKRYDVIAVIGEPGETYVKCNDDGGMFELHVEAEQSRVEARQEGFKGKAYMVSQYRIINKAKAAKETNLQKFMDEFEKQLNLHLEQMKYVEHRDADILQVILRSVTAAKEAAEE